MPPLPCRFAEPRAAGLVRFGDRLVARHVLAAAASPAALPRLAVEDLEFVDPDWVKLHRDGFAPTQFELAALGPVPITMSGPGLLWLDDALLAEPAIMPVYVGPELMKFPEPMLNRPRALPARTDPRPGFVFHAWGVQVYGHFLIEMLPRLLSAAKFGTPLHGALPVLNRAMPGWSLTILREQFGIADEHALWFDSNAEQLALERAIVLPQFLRPGGYHPLARELFADFGARFSKTGAPRRLFVARGDYRNPAQDHAFWKARPRSRKSRRRISDLPLSNRSISAFPSR